MVVADDGVVEFVASAFVEGDEEVDDGREDGAWAVGVLGVLDDPVFHALECVALGDFHDAEFWIASRDPMLLFSLENICDALEFNVSWMRAGLQKRIDAIRKGRIVILKDDSALYPHPTGLSRTERQNIIREYVINQPEHKASATCLHDLFRNYSDACVNVDLKRLVFLFKEIN